MKKLTIAVAILIITAFACKKHKGQKCLWNATDNRNFYFTWRVNPSSDQIKKAQDSCSCTLTVKETCVPCDVSLTDAAGNDIECK